MSGLLAERGGPGLGWSVWATRRAPPVFVRGPPAASPAGRGRLGQPGTAGRPVRPPSCCVIMTRVGTTRGPGLPTPFMGGPEAVYPHRMMVRLYPGL